MPAMKAALTARVDAIREYFTLRQTDARAAKIPAERRTEMQRALVLARQKREAAEVLWLSGALAEGLKLAAESFTLAAQSAEPTTPARADEIAAIKKKLEDAKLPELEDGVTDEHKKLFETLVDAHDSLRRELGLLSLDDRARTQKRIQRRVGFAIGILAFFVLVWLVVRTPKVLRAEASAQYSDTQPASNATDGKNDTEWHLPDGQAGWIDLWVQPVRKLKTMKVLNAIIHPYNDRGTKDYHIDVFGRGAKLIKSIDGKFEFTPDPQWVTIPLDTTEDVERIRFEVRTFYAKGGGLAEVTVE